MKNNKISLLTILASLTYTFLVVSTIVYNWDDVQSGMMEGRQDAESHYLSESQPSPNDRNYYLNLKPKGGFVSFRIRSSIQKTINLSGQNLLT